MTVKPIQRSEIQGFSKGLVTDLNPLNSQIDTTYAEDNFELHKDGTRSRRLGLNKENNGNTFNTGLPLSYLQLSATGSFLWKSVAGEPSLEFFVFQLGEFLYFFELNAGASGETVYRGSLGLGVASSSQVKFSSVQGFLGIVTGSSNLFLVEYSIPNGTFTLSTFRLQIRDFFGIEETINANFEVDTQYRGPLNWQHYYNLYNQGWGIPRKPWEPVNGAPQDTVLLGSNYNTGGNSPSNSAKVWSGITTRPVSDTSRESYEAFDYRQYEAILGADNVPSKGFFIIDAFNRGSSRASQWVSHKNKYPVTGNLAGGFSPPEDATSGGPTSVATHAGRLFYSGCNGGVVNGDKRSPNYNNYVFFTQLIKNRQDFGKCYQEGDPTSRDSNDLVDTDGGYVVISDAINIHTMYSLGDKLFLVAENGVWTISGGSGYGFSATNYMVERLSSFGGVPGHSFVELGGTCFFWGYDGIYTIGKNQFGDYEVVNQSKKVIDRFYRNIDPGSLSYVQGFADKQRNQVRWIYTKGSLFTDAQTYELILDLNFQAFIPFTISKHTLNQAYVISGVQTGDFKINYISSDVVVGGDEVDAGVDEVGADDILQVATDANVKYLSVILVSGNLSLVFCEYNNVDFEDWEFTGTSVDAPAYMESNAFTGGDFSIKKQVPYLTMAFAETEKTLIGDDVIQASSCIGQFKWDFSHLERSNKWTREMQLYRKSRWFFGDSDIDNGFSLNIVKTKVRGIGKSFALRVRTEPKLECHIYGWNLSLTNNST